jgi:gamma-glutamylcysteine synthetase
MPTIEEALDYCRTNFHRTSPSLAGKRWVGIENEYPLVLTNGDIIERDVLDYLWQELAGRGWEIQHDEVSGQAVAAKKPSDDGCGHKRYHYDLITTDLGYAILEINLAPSLTLHDAYKRLFKIIRQITIILEKKGAVLLGYGIHPCASPQKRHLGPKSRYLLLSNLCREENKGMPDGSGVELHTVDAACQTHVDVSWQEAVPVINALNATSSLRIALLANSLVWGNRLGVHKATRVLFANWCWPSRKQQLGMPPAFQNLEHYLRYIFDFRPIGIVRDHKLYRLYNHGTFHRFFTSPDGQMGIALDGEQKEIVAQLDDIKLQCSFAWFSTRLQPAYGTIEDRISCQQPPQEHLCASALTLGLVENAAELAALAQHLSLDQWCELYFLAATHGSSISYSGVHIDQYLDTLLAIAMRGLQQRGYGEEIYLAPLYQRRAAQRCPADNVCAQFAQGGIEQIVSENDMRNWN